MEIHRVHIPIHNWHTLPQGILHTGWPGNINQVCVERWGYLDRVILHQGIGTSIQSHLPEIHRDTAKGPELPFGEV